MSKSLWTFVSALSVYAAAFSANSMEDIKPEDQHTDNKIIEKPVDENRITETKSNTAVQKRYMYGKSVINETNSLKRIKQSIGNVDEKVLVICDIDNTILKNNHIIDAKAYEKDLDYIVARFMQKFPSYAKEIDKYTEIAHETMEEVLVDEEWLNFIKYIKERGGKMIAFSAIEHKKVYEKMLIDMRAEKLKKVGIDFSGSFDLPSKSFFETGNDNEKYVPYYDKKSHIVATQPKSKGDVLVYFLSYTKYIPNKVVAIDDQIQNLIDINDVCLANGMKFLGYEYTSAKQIKYDVPFSYEHIFFQLKYLVENKRFLPDKEADQLMRSINAKMLDEQKEFLANLKENGNITPEETVTRAEQQQKIEEPKNEINKNEDIKEDTTKENVIEEKGAKNNE